MTRGDTARYSVFSFREPVPARQCDVAYTQDASEREKSCMEGENRTRVKLAADWSTFPAEERARCIKSIEWFSPTYTELIACLEMYGDVRRAREYAATPDKPRR